MKKILIIILILAALGSLVLLLNRPEESKASLDDFAQCLAEKEVTMYGADWCPHCQNEKKAFGDSFRLVPYVECPQEPQRCLAALINVYPSWIFQDGRRLEGEQGIEKLSLESECALP